MDADWIAAAGVSQVRGRPLPAQVARWIAGDAAMVSAVGRTLGGMWVSHRRITRHLTDDVRDDILEAMTWWGASTCPDCEGRGHRKILDAPALEEAPCLTCDGTGRRGHDRKTTAYAWALGQLDEAAAVCGRSIGERVG